MEAQVETDIEAEVELQATVKVGSVERKGNDSDELNVTPESPTKIMTTGAMILLIPEGVTLNFNYTMQHRP